MKFKINDKIQFIDLAEHIKHGKSYNVTILEAKVRETGFTDRQLEQIGKILETALAPIHKRLDRLEDFAVKQLAFNRKIESLPTIAKELEEKDKK